MEKSVATKKPVVPAWIKERVGKTKFKLVKLVEKKQSWDCQHAVIRLLSPVTVWKWIRFDEDCASLYQSDRYKRHTVPLLLPTGALVVLHKKEKKCRTNKAKYMGSKPGHSAYRSNFKYIPGRVITEKLDPPNVTCGSGIHFCFNESTVRYY